MASNTSISTITVSTFPSLIISFEANHIKFWILLALQLFSIPCFLYIFFQFLRKPQLRQSHHHHHAILLLLIVSFLFVTTALPFTEAYMFRSHVYPPHETFCSFWNWIHYSLNIINLWLMAFTCLERNWLIFHPWLVRNKRGKILFHYSPLAFCLFYPPLFYFSAIFIHQCQSDYDYTELLCTWPCYFLDQHWANIDLFLNNYIPLFSIPIFCLIIYVRVFFQKRAMKQQAFKWHRDKKLVLQLWAISTLYLAMWMPLQLAGLINLYWDPTFFLQAQIDYMYLFPYLIHLIYPLIVLFTYPHELLHWKKNMVHIQTNTI